MPNTIAALWFVNKIGTIRDDEVVTKYEKRNKYEAIHLFSLNFIRQIDTVIWICCVYNNTRAMRDINISASYVRYVYTISMKRE